MSIEAQNMMMPDYPTLSYTMGFSVNNSPIPDPSAFSGKESDLDTMGERDATGYLHRNRVATKHPLSIEYRNIPWNVITKLCKLLTEDTFQFQFPDPFSYTERTTIDAYAGDRDFSAVWSPTYGIWLGNLKVSIIEY